MNSAFNVSTLALALVLAGCDSSLQREKVRAVQKISEMDSALLKKVSIERMHIEFVDPGPESVDVEGGSFSIPRANRKQEHDRGTSLDYPAFQVQFPRSTGGGQFSNLPPSWGRDDLEKLFFICGASQADIEAATNADELSAALSLLTARATVAPVGSLDRIIWLEGDRFVGLLTGDFSTSSRMELCLRPGGNIGTTHVISFRRGDGGTTEDVLQFIRSLAFKPRVLP